MRIVPLVALTTGLVLAAPVPALGATDHAAVSRQSSALPSVPQDVTVRATFTGVDLTWRLPVDEADSVSSFTVSRTVGSQTDTFQVFRSGPEPFGWTAPELVPGATYSVAAATADGLGPASAPIQPAPAREAISTAQYRRNSDGSGRWFLSQAARDGLQLVPFAPDGITQSGITDVAASVDGSQLAFTQGGASIWTTPANKPNGVAVKILDNSSGIKMMAWSPDGSRIAYERRTVTGDNCLEIVAATGGTPIRVGCGMVGPAWLPDGQTLVVQDAVGRPLRRVQAKAAGATLLTYTGTDRASVPVVSPDGRWIAYSIDKAVAVIPVGGGTPLLGEARGTSLRSVAWSPDATRVAAIRSAQFAGDSVWVAAIGADGKPGPETRQFIRPEDESIFRLGWHGQGVKIELPATTLGPSISVPFRIVAPQPGQTASCQLDNTPAAACVSPYKKTGLTAGSHTLRVKVTDADGRAAMATRSFTVDATAPVAKIINPTFALTKAGTATVTYGATDPSGVASYDLRYRTAHYNGTFGAYANPRIGSKLTSLTLNLAAGYEYCFSVRARDSFGNLSGWSAERCFARPVDDRSLTAVGVWNRQTSSQFYLGTATATNRPGAALTRTVKGKQVYVVATRCPGCGSVQVFYGGKLAGILYLYRPQTERQVLLALPVSATAINGTVKLVTRNSQLVQIDGLAVRKG
ncbi:hypothetical protein OG394_18670 [Kribbella sp. NBC_01245]|uniref:hypothetical protein n=1 Tax=Kribbella sp. NBC_01245 TaxID=2903578 RepID=UPI002E29CBDB|nr:hypothetical protein [Kribbella sp. NBC_01245]